MAYKDRGLKKWGGFILSEHTAHMEQSNRIPQWKVAMDEAAIQSILTHATSHHVMLAIQEYQAVGIDAQPDIVGQLIGIEGDSIYIRTSSGIQAIELTNIRHVEERRIEKWYS
ncbi:hypothetical protein [Paenilisteria rocourtiae]|uniref:YolD-like protein n=1 Tax=Listeria rocourtiae TaxID=647910 RepID=A0A4R6ZGW4_9LIST|nr:hypothetical protein [Listeria rocourtiae]EUJ47411.1 hypothetical protein PROCOU_08936 [Listeria rocourtiae FSL F6-920]MBC1435373.1 hypothetical protein [Listeria rocourtiae]MBC1605416.1 hypothetical protein [Listeria rocourtiae]TDR51521.1 hypothetical protein DFP96_1125 [Listeria rocourtiae]